MSEDLIVKITDQTFSQDIEKGVVLIDFFAAWCCPCRMLSPILEQVAAHFKGKIKVGKLDIDANQKIAAQYQVTSVPTMIIYKNGKEHQRLVGLKDFDSIKDFITAAL